MDTLLSFVGTFGAILVVLFLVAALFAILSRLVRLYEKVGPNEALIVFGRGQMRQDEQGRPVPTGARVIIGGGVFVWPYFETSVRWPLGVLTIEEPNDTVITSTFIPVELDWVSQLQTPPEREMVLTAFRAFKGMDQNEKLRVIKTTLSANFREVIATFTPEDVLREKEKFSAKVSEVAGPEMGKLGLTILSLNVRDVTDKNGYFDALAKPRIAQVRRDAEIAQATATKEAEIAKAQATQEQKEKQAAADLAASKAQLEAEQKKSDYQKSLAVQQALNKAEADAKKADAEIAYDLQESLRKKELATKQGEVDAEKQRQAGLIAEQRLAVAEREQRAQVIIPALAAKEAATARAEALRVETVTAAEAEATATKARAEAEASRVRQTKEAEASGVAALGQATAEAEKARLLAQAEGERQLAEARAAQNEINLRQAIADALIKSRVEIAQSIATALAGVGSNVKVVSIGNGNVADQNPLFSMLTQIPEIATVINAKSDALAGKDVLEVLEEVLRVVRATKDATDEPKVES